VGRCRNPDDEATAHLIAWRGIEVTEVNVL